MERDMCDEQGDIEDFQNQLPGESSGNSINPKGRAEYETMIVISYEEGEIVSGEDGNSKLKTNVERKVDGPEQEKHDCIIDVKCSGGSLSGENLNREKVCRICHLSFECPYGTSDLIQLGCRCKDELGISHRHCAETWFKRKGNRKCEICCETAKNITGTENNGFRAEWNEMRLMGGATNSSDRESSCWRRQPFCNFLLACLVLAFILPWFFHVDLL